MKKQEVKHVRLWLPVETHLKLRAMAGAAGMPMSLYVQKMVEQKVNEETKTRQEYHRSAKPPRHKDGVMQFPC